MIKAIVYARFSPRPDAAESESIEAQVATCRAFAERLGYDVAALYEDRDASGSDGPENRPGLATALLALRKNNVLLVSRRDRLARDLFLSLWIEKQVKVKRARIVSVAGEGNGEDPQAELMRNIVDSFAQYEREIIRRRTRAAMQAYQAGGRRMSRHAPFGWAVDSGHAAFLVEVPEEQALIAQIVKMHADGMKLRQICRELDFIDQPCRGGTWQHTTVANILKRAGVRQRVGHS